MKRIFEPFGKINYDKGYSTFSYIYEHYETNNPKVYLECHFHDAENALDSTRIIMTESNVSKMIETLSNLLEGNKFKISLVPEASAFKCLRINEKGKIIFVSNNISWEMGKDGILFQPNYVEKLNIETVQKTNVKKHYLIDDVRGIAPERAYIEKLAQSLFMGEQYPLKDLLEKFQKSESTKYLPKRYLIRNFDLFVSAIEAYADKKDLQLSRYTTDNPKLKSETKYKKINCIKLTPLTKTQPKTYTDMIISTKENINTAIVVSKQYLGDLKDGELFCANGYDDKLGQTHDLNHYGYKYKDYIYYATTKGSAQIVDFEKLNKKLIVYKFELAGVK